ncbi:MAG: hypothetical protein V1770_06380, partial [bacterium]
ENKIVIKIKKEVKEVFEYSIDPAHTPLWSSSITKEETNEWPVRMGTVYKNSNSEGKWSEYVVSGFERNKIFELTSEDGNYHVRYTYSSNDAGTVMEYFEWVDNGELDEPYDRKHLEKLRNLIEAI